MRSLHDVFTAICADEGDHVSAMEACLDVDANLLAPSLERRILAGVAALALSSFLLSSSGVMDAGGLLDSANVFGDVSAAASESTTLELIAAGVAGLVQQFVQDGNAEDMAGVGENLAEGGAALTAVEELRRFGAAVAGFFSRLL